jgi:ABC-2 type transport system permease protein
MSAHFLLPAATLWRRELTRFLRQRSRVAGAILQPLFFWLLFGMAFESSFSVPSAGRDVSYLEFFFPGTLVLIVLFSSIFSTFSVIEDRNKGFLQAVLVAPIPRSAMVAGKVVGGATLAFLQGLVFLFLAPVIGISASFAGFAATAGVLALVALSLTALGFVCAWRMESTQGFHAVMSAVLLPMWLLSGAFFPAEGAPAVLRWIVAANPLTYGVSAMRHALYLGGGSPGMEMPSAALSLGVTVAFGAVAFAASVRVACARRSR